MKRAPGNWRDHTTYTSVIYSLYISSPTQRSGASLNFRYGKALLPLLSRNGRNLYLVHGTLE